MEGMLFNLASRRRPAGRGDAKLKTQQHDFTAGFHPDDAIIERFTSVSLGGRLGRAAGFSVGRRLCCF